MACKKLNNAKCGFGENCNDCPNVSASRSNDLLSADTSPNDYVQYGDEWEKEMTKLPKKILIGMIRNIKTGR